MERPTLFRYVGQDPDSLAPDEPERTWVHIEEYPAGLSIGTGDVQMPEPGWVLLTRAEVARLYAALGEWLNRN